MGFLSRVSRLLGVCLGVLMLAALIVNSLTVSYEHSMNELGNNTRDIHETNKELHIKLNRLQAFKNVEEEAARVPQLHPVTETLEVKTRNKPRRIQVPERKQEFPEAYGY